MAGSETPLRGLVSLQPLMQVIVWLAGKGTISEEELVEELGDRDLVHRRVEAAYRLLLVTRDANGIRLTDGGWALAAGDE